MTSTKAATTALAPTGTLRAAINLSNFLLVSGAEVDGRPRGVSPGMANALGDRLGVPVELLSYPNPGDVADGAARGEWDIGNIGAEPARAEHIEFTAAYAEIESTYLVPADSTFVTPADVDQPGVVVSVKERAAYALWLERNLRHAELVETPTLDSSYDVFVDRRLGALAGLRPRLLADAERLPGSRVLDGSFTSVQQAIGTPRGRDPAGIEFLRDFVEFAKVSGLVSRLIDEYSVVGLSVADPA